ncbi:VWA domain-containing protein [Roseovarius gahaiensis]|uniref:VWA domain-containing protein n=2 Tax=Roseovarius gahaiensis TaxID=2716691 RepID=A0A967EDL5_9RHOB|nr:VWA domain-containing protein [Roseovarius gahaiensis]
MASAADRPLLMDGKESLFERVLVRDSTAMFDAPDGRGSGQLRPLQPLYVYAESGDWLRVARGDKGDDLFWVPANTVTPWRQNIVATLQTSANLDRTLFFSDYDAIYDVVESEAPGLSAQTLRQEAEAAETANGDSERIVALGPRDAVNLRDNLYVMPILETEEAIFENGSFVNLLKVAVARAQPDDAPIDNDPVADVTPEEAQGAFRAGVVFVVDTTISMEPFIRRTQAALEEVYDGVRRTGAQEAVSFGLIGFRDNLQAAPGLGYDVQTFVDLNAGFDASAFLNGITRMTEAGASSRNFREDSYAGIEHALQAMDWSPFGAKFIVLVTDASPREANDGYSKTRLSAKGLGTLVRENINGAIAVMHLRTPQGPNDHDRAEAAYRELTRQPNVPPLYFPIENGDRDEYQARARQLGQIVADQVNRFRGGQDPRDFSDDDDTIDEDTKAFRAAGRTMQLEYLGRSRGSEAPDVFEAVVADRDFARPGLKPLSIRLLLTKAELSNLDEALRIIIEKAEENVINPDDFFGQVLGAAADMSRRPDKVSRRSDPTLAEAVNVSEFIEDLPYKSRIMAITEADWVRMSISEQQTVVNELYEKIERYRRYNAATDQWVDYLGAGASAGGLVYPMMLDDLP